LGIGLKTYTLCGQAWVAAGFLCLSRSDQWEIDIIAG